MSISPELRWGRSCGPGGSSKDSGFYTGLRWEPVVGLSLGVTPSSLKAERKLAASRTPAKHRVWPTVGAH